MIAPAAEWQLDRLSTSARGAAERAALGAGIPLSSWLTNLINETCSAEGITPQAKPRNILGSPRESHDHAAAPAPREPAPMPIPANITMPPAPQSGILDSLSAKLQRDDISPVDEAQAYLHLLRQGGVDVSAITAAVGRDRKHIIQSLRLLALPPLVRHLVGTGVLSREHAVVLLDAPQPEALAHAILAEQLSAEAARQRIIAGAESKA